jgi:hypothetical protein
VNPTLSLEFRMQADPDRSPLYPEPLHLGILGSSGLFITTVCLSPLITRTMSFLTFSLVHAVLRR